MKTIDIMLPVYYGNFDELEPSIRKQIAYYKENLKDFKWTIVIAINGPLNKNEKIMCLAKDLSKKYEHVRYMHSPVAGKGSGIVNSWSASDADILSYMDIDLSTNLGCLRDIANGILTGYDLAIGSRYLKGSAIKRSFKRWFLSAAYHLIFTKLILSLKCKDAQCGFKAASPKIKELLTLVKDKNWFFETELLYLAQNKGYKIKEVPVIWTENKFSGVKLWTAIPQFVKKSLELRLRKA